MSRGFLADQVESLLGLLAEFGAVTAGKEPAVTPLLAWLRDAAATMAAMSGGDVR